VGFWKLLTFVAVTCAVAFASVLTPWIAWGEEVYPSGKWIFGLQGGVSMMTKDVGNGNGAVTEGSSAPVWSGRMLYRITDSAALGIGLEWEEHVIRNTAPAPLDFGRSSTFSHMAILELYPPLWPTFSDSLSNYPLFPYGLIGVGQNKNSFTESAAFSNSCIPSSACSVSLEDTLAVKIAAGFDYLITPDLSINAEIGWKLNSGKSRTSTTKNAGGDIVTSNDGYEASTASVLIGLRYFFEKPEKPKPRLMLAVSQKRAPEPEAIPPPKPSQQEPKNAWTTRVLFFESSSWAINDEGKAFLMDAAGVLNASPKTPIQIEGHTDLHGSKRGNIWIAQKRAEAVMEVLTEAGVSNPIRVISYGDSQPLGRADTLEVDHLNRRVIIKWLAPDKE